MSELRKAKTRHFYKLIEEASGNSFKLWQHINRLTNSSKQKHPKINCLNGCDELTTSNESIANGINHFFIESVKELGFFFLNLLSHLVMNLTMITQTPSI